jgi:hypothetical protein
MADEMKAQEVPETRAEPARHSPSPAAVKAGEPGDAAKKPKSKSVDDPWGEEWFPADRRTKR